MLQSFVFPLANILACGFSLLMYVRCWRELGYLPKECALSIFPILMFGIGYIFVIAGMLENLVALRGVLFFLFLSPGIAALLRIRENKRA